MIGWTKQLIQLKFKNKRIMGNEANTMKKLTTAWDDQKGLLKRFYKRHDNFFKCLSKGWGRILLQRFQVKWSAGLFFPRFRKLQRNNLTGQCILP